VLFKDPPDRSEISQGTTVARRNWPRDGDVMNKTLIVAILLVADAPVYAQDQQSNAIKLKADAQKEIPSACDNRKFCL
jgi:hypothetical protein